VDRADNALSWTRTATADQKRKATLTVNTIMAKKRNLEALSTPTHQVTYSSGQQQTIQKSKLLKISPPQRQVGEKLEIADHQDILDLFREDGFEEYIGANNEQERILTWMYGRNYISTDPARRKRELSKMIDPKQDKIYERAIRFVSSPDADKVAPTENVSLSQWGPLAKDYGNPNENGWNAFRDYGSRWIQRVQPSGTCWVHAAVVTQSYLLKETENIEVVDILKYSRSAFTDEKLSSFIVSDGGGNAQEELVNMLENKGITTIYPENLGDEFDTPCDGNCNCGSQILHDLRQFGPALVHCFLADNSFRNTKAVFEGGKIHEIPFFDGNIGDDTEKHAMVLVGVRKVEGKWRCLLQNWWPLLQLVEVSADYLQKSKAMLVQVVRPQSGIPAKFGCCSAEYAEATLGGEDISKSSDPPERSSGNSRW